MLYVRNNKIKNMGNKILVLVGGETKKKLCGCSSIVPYLEEKKRKKKASSSLFFLIEKSKEEERSFLASCSIGWCLGGGMFDVVP